MMSKDKKNKSVHVQTLGCKLNYAETSAVLENFVRNGWEISAGDDVPDLVIIHTCAVTGKAGQKSRRQIRKMIKKYPDSRIAVVGCYAQLSPENIENISGVDVILGSGEKFVTEKYIRDYSPAVYKEISSPVTFEKAIPAHSLLCDRASGRTRAFLKIQDGCSYGCAYCVIPLARGRSRSVSFENVIEGACELAAAGYREIVLTGVNIADYRSGSATIVELLKELDSLNNLRIRVSSIEPDVLSDKLIETVASSSRIMPHFHLPLQSGSDNILALMRRRYTSASYRERFLMAAGTIPGCAIGADVITGYPGETETDFRSTYRLLELLPAAYLHVFPCSVRPGTVLEDQVSSGALKAISPETAHTRSNLLLALAETKQKQFAQKYIGKKLKVLFEGCITSEKGENIISGYSENYLRINVRVENSRPLDLVGREKAVRVEDIDGDLILEGRFVT